MRKAIFWIVRLSMRLAAVYSLLLAAACLLLAGTSAVRLFIFNRAPNDSASGLDPTGVLLACSGSLVFAAAGRWAWKTARAFGRTRPAGAIRDEPRPSSTALDNDQTTL